MQPIDHLNLALRNKYIIILAIVAGLFSSYYFHQSQNSSKFESTTFLSFSIKDGTPDNINQLSSEPADQMAESIQGWFKSPYFLDEINKQTELNLNIRAKKQEKNNLLVTFNIDTKENAQKALSAINSSLQQRISQYNNSSDLKLYTAINESQLSEKSNNLSIYLILGLIIGIIAGYCSAMSWEYLDGQLLSRSDIKKIFKKDPLEVSFSKRIFLKQLIFLSKLIEQKFHHESIQILDLTNKHKFGLEVISKHTNFTKLKCFNFPEEEEKIDFNKPTLVIVELGFSKKTQLQRISKLELPTLETLMIEHL